MFYRKIFKYFHQKLYADKFWPISYFSWVYFHWMGSSMIFGTIFSIVIIVTHVASWILMYGKVVLESVKYAETSVLLALAYCTMLTRTLVVPFIVMIWMMRGRRRVSLVFSTIVNVDETLSKFGQCPSRMSILWKLLFVVLLPLILIEGLTFVDMNNGQQSDIPVAQRVLIFHARYHELVELFIQYFFACLALLLGDRYKAVNSMLKKMYHECTKDFRNTRRSTSDWIIAVRELRGVHRKLFFAAENISEALSFQLLIITIVSLISIVGDFYNFYLLNALPCTPGAKYPSLYLLWCMIHVCPLCITASCCSWTSAQEKYTSILLQEMIVSDENLRMEISTFSLQLIHHDVHFSVCGFYNVGLPFIQNIVGIAATYLVILIQIERLPNTCRNSLISMTENVYDNYSAKY